MLTIDSKLAVDVSIVKYMDRVDGFCEIAGVAHGFSQMEGVSHDNTLASRLS
jgi:hypothetical protein